MRFEGMISRPFSDEKLRGMIHHFRRILKELSLPDRTKTVKSSLIFGGLGLTPKLEPTRVSPEPVGWRPQISRLSPERSPGRISYSLFSWSFPFLFSDFFFFWRVSLVLNPTLVSLISSKSQSSVVRHLSKRAASSGTMSLAWFRDLLG